MNPTPPSPPLRVAAKCAPSGASVAPWLMMGAILLFHLKPLICGVSFQDPTAFRYDLIIAYPSVQSITRDFLQNAYPPLWISYGHLGFPYLAAFIPSVIHPTTAPFYLLSFASSIAAMSMTLAMLTALFSWLFFRRAGASPWGAAAAGLLLVLSGFFPWITTVYHVGIALPWLMLWMWSAVELADRPRFRFFAANLVAVLMLLWGGDPQMLVEGAYVVSAWFVLYLGLARLSARTAARTIILVVAAAAAGMLASQHQVLPTLMMTKHMVRLTSLSLAEYEASFPQVSELAAAGAGLLSRRLINLFVPLSVVLLLAAGVIGRRGNPFLRAILVLALFISILLLGAHSGLAVITYHLPMIKGFIRHYKMTAILQGPLFVGVALGFDALASALAQRSRGFIAGSLLVLVATAALIWNPGWSAVLLLAGAATGTAVWKNRARLLPALLFAVLAADVGSYAWHTPYSLKYPEIDPVYPKYVARAGVNARVQGMYSLATLLAPGCPPPLPMNAYGYHHDYSIDTIFDYVFVRHAWFIRVIIRPDQAGPPGRDNYTFAFKHSDLVTPQNLHLLDLAAVRYFFLYQMALSEADVFPILSDPAYFANPARPRAFRPWQLTTAQGQPALTAGDFGTFRYQHPVRPGDRLTVGMGWQRGANSKSGLATLINRAPGRARLLFARTVSPRETGAAILAAPLEPSLDGLEFALMPIDANPGGPPTTFRFVNPKILNPDRPLHYLEGSTVMVFENRQVLGRARVVHRALTAADYPSAVRLMRDPKRFDPRQETVLMGPAAVAVSGPAPSLDEKATVEADFGGAVIVRARLQSPGYLVLSDMYYPGWMACDETGHELKITPADICMRALALPAGEHLITFRYLPPDFRVGLMASLASILALSAAAASRKWPRFFHHPENRSAPRADVHQA